MTAPTPRVTQHAAERCAEMGISTKVAKRIVRNADLTRPGNPALGRDCMVATSDREPDYAVVVAPGDPPIVVTVLFRTTEVYARCGTAYIPLEGEAE